MSKQSDWQDEVGIDLFLQEAMVGLLVTITPDGWPLAQPMNFLWQGGSIFVYSSPNGEKMDNLRNNPKVAFSVVEALAHLTSDFTAAVCHNPHLGRSVFIRGLAKEVKDLSKKARLIGKIIAKYDPGLTLNDTAEMFTPEYLTTQPSFNGCALVEIEVSRLSARQFLLNDKPLEYRRAVAAHFQKAGQEKGGDTLLLKTARILLSDK